MEILRNLKKEEGKSMDLINYLAKIHDSASSTGTGGKRVTVFQFCSLSRPSTNTDSVSSPAKLPPKVLNDKSTDGGGFVTLREAQTHGNNDNGAV